MAGIDFIADVHGHHDALVRLLTLLGYAERGGAWRHPERRVVFIGDLIDRGPAQVETVDLVRRMLDAGSGEALIGNHEYNAIGFFRRGRDGRHLRPRSEKNRRQHHTFLAEVGEDSPLHREIIGFFERLPVYLEGPGWRAVHACWDPPEIAALSPHLDAANTILEDSWEACFATGAPARNACEILLKGHEAVLPEDARFTDVDGNLRDATRIRWWDASAHTIAQAAIRDHGIENAALPDIPLPYRVPLLGESILFFGHYWLFGQPAIIDAHHVCLDYSVAKGGHLVAYRFDGEKAARPDGFVSVPAR